MFASHFKFILQFKVPLDALNQKVNKNFIIQPLISLNKLDDQFILLRNYIF